MWEVNCFWINGIGLEVMYGVGIIGIEVFVEWYFFVV